jgi:hypothetical protein
MSRMHTYSFGVAGYTDAQGVDIGLTFAVVALTNTFNRINDTTVDVWSV